MADVFTPEQIEQMSAELNRQLLALSVAEPVALKGDTSTRPRAARQRHAIEQATRQDATTFLARFREAARQDLCEADGVLHKQWEKYRDIASKDMLNRFGVILVGLGLTGGVLQTVAVAVAAYVLYLGVKAFCAGEA